MVLLFTLFIFGALRPSLRETARISYPIGKTHQETTKAFPPPRKATVPPKATASDVLTPKYSIIGNANNVRASHSMASASDHMRA